MGGTKTMRSTLLYVTLIGAAFVMCIYTVQNDIQKYWFSRSTVTGDWITADNTELFTPPERPSPVDILNQISTSMTRKLLVNSLQLQNDSATAKPRQSQTVILTTWRSGSTFLESVLDAHEGMYNIYEPLLHFELRHIQKGDPEANEADTLINDLLNCRYRNENYLNMTTVILEMLARNPRVWNTCNKAKKGADSCYSATVLENSCQLFPWTVMKLVRADMSLLESSLNDQNLNVQVIFLVRDPRGVMNSRISSVEWCKQSDCSSSRSLCEAMSSNLHWYTEYRTRYPDRVHLLRYEDLCLDPLQSVKDLFHSLQLSFDSDTEQFIKTNTKGGPSAPWSVSRNSKEKLTSWTKTLSRKHLFEIQSTCVSVMETLGYAAIENLSNVAVNEILKPLSL